MIPSDRNLITQYLRHNEQFAFDQLVCRHSEMVMKVCRNMLSQNADAEDAFQATFLVLARKVHTLRDRSSIAGWLYEVAIRNCLQVHQRRRRARETELQNDNAIHDGSPRKRTCSTHEPWKIVAQSEEARVVLAEINQLPTKYREVIVLCCVDEHSRRDTANLLNQTEAAVKGLLTRARSLLKSRLIKRGIAPAAALAVSQTETCLGAPTMVNPGLVEATLRTCADPISSKLGSPSDSVDATGFVSSVATESLRQMGYGGKARLATIAVVLLVLVAVPLAVLAQKPGQMNASETPVANWKASETDKSKNAIEEKTEVTGSTFYERFTQISPARFESHEPSATTSVSGVARDQNGKPVESALVVLRALTGTESVGGKYNGIIVKTTTDPNGSYSFENIHHLRKHSILEVVAATEDGSLGWKNFSGKQGKSETNISLSKTIPVRGRIVDEKGVAVHKASVTLVTIDPQHGNAGESSIYYRRLSSPEVQTDAQGHFEFPALPKNALLTMIANHPDFAVSQVFEMKTGEDAAEIVDFELKAGELFSGRVLNQAGRPVVGAEICFPGRVFTSGDDGIFSFCRVEEPQSDGVVYFVTRHPEFGVSQQRVEGYELKAGTAVIKLSKLAEIRGRVVAKDNGLPVPGARVSGFNSQRKFGSIGTYLNDNGEFVLKGVSPGVWTLSFSGAPGFDLRHESCINCEVTLKPEEIKEVKYSVPRIDPIEIRVVDELGQPVVGAEVNASLRHANRYRSLFRKGWPVTDMDGSTSLLPDLRPDGSTVLIAKWKRKGKVYWAQQFWSEKNEADELILKPAATLKGKVTVEGKPIVGARIQVENRLDSILVTEGDMTTSIAARRRFFESVETDSNGVYSLEVPAVTPLGNPPVYILTLQSSGNIPNRDVHLLSEAASFDGTNFNKDFDLIKGEGKVSGSVVDAHGNPIQNVLVSAFRISSLANGESVRPDRLYLPGKTKTDKNGEFALEGMPVGAIVSLATRHSKASDLKNYDKKAYRTTRDVLVSAEANTKFVLPLMRISSQN